MDDEDVIRKQLLEDNAYFKKVLNLIPASFYFSEDAKQKLKAQEGKTDNAKKRHASDAMGNTRQKRNKYDPTQLKSVTELQEYLIKVEETEKSQASGVKKSKSKTVSATHSKEELRQKLHEYLNQLKAKRNGLGKEDFLEKKKLKRRESKMKRKLKLEKQKGNKEKEHATTNGKTSQKSPAKKPIYNKDGKLVFSKFDLADDRKKKTGLLTGKDYKTLLEKVQKQKEKIDKLKEKDAEKAKQLVEKMQWNKAIQKAEGIKVKDDPELLKRSLKRKEKMKEKRKKLWEEREEKVKEKMKERQEKRRTNIQKRKHARIDKKIAKAKKKGRIIPGF